VARVDAHARIAFFLRKVKKALQPGKLLEAALHVGGLGLDLLHTHTIRPRGGDPLLQAFARGRADAVEIEAA
jgi:hypothetical protein